MIRDQFEAAAELADISPASRWAFTESRGLDLVLKDGGGRVVDGFLPEPVLNRRRRACH